MHMHVLVKLIYLPILKNINPNIKYSNLLIDDNNRRNLLLLYLSCKLLRKKEAVINLLIYVLFYI